METTMSRWLAAGGSFFFAVNVLFGAPALTGVQRPAASPQSDVMTDSVRVAVPRVDVDGCAITPIACNTIATGRLASGDCTTAGKFTDFYVFHGTAGDYVEATIRPLASSLSRPLVGILPPAGDASKTPVVYGGKEGATAAFLISTTGNWTLAAGTDDLFGSGDYALQLECERDPFPNDPHSCFALPLLCNQTVEWDLTNESCRWDDGSGVYNDFVIQGVAGDVLNVDMTATGFTPLFGIYSADGAILASANISGGHARTTFFVPANAEYHVLATANEDRATGPFSVTVSCGLSGCLAPVILQQPPATITVPFGQRATLTGSANATADLQFEWFDARDLPTSVGRGTTFQTPAVTSKQTYYYTARTACGQVSSRLITVTPATGRRRSVGH
jgi:hypothetical protein